jgi:hypothetical protein
VLGGGGDSGRRAGDAGAVRLVALAGGGGVLARMGGGTDGKGPVYDQV